MFTKGHAASLVELASHQWGLVTSRQARVAASVSPQQLKRMTDSGVLERLHHGLYRLARLPHDEHLDKRLAWIALDPERVVWERLDQDVPTGVLSHRTAAEVHQLGDLDADVVELTATRRIRLSLPDVIVHRSHLTRDDWQIVNELPVTTPIRTISDLAAAATDVGHLASVVRDALTRSLVTTEAVASILAPHAFDYGHRALDGQEFLDALIEQAGVPATLLALADIARKRPLAGAVSPTVEQLSAQIARSVATAAAPQLEQINAELVRTMTPAMKALVESAAVRNALAQSFASVPNSDALIAATEAQSVDPAVIEAVARAIAAVNR